MTALARRLLARHHADRTHPYRTFEMRIDSSIGSESVILNAGCGRTAGLKLESLEYLSQYPNYLMSNGVLFFFGMCFEKLIHRFEALRILRGWILVMLRKPDGGPATSESVKADAGNS